MLIKPGTYIDPDGVNYLKEQLKIRNQKQKEELHEYEIMLKDLVPKDKLRDYIRNECRKLKSKISGLDYSINSHQKEIERLENSKKSLERKEARYRRMLLDE